ncbi:MAG: MoxR family ATPase [Armatimonadetes bacterium]|nr:MoxR family ATPase [Armatimonadota bacterium]
MSENASINAEQEAQWFRDTWAKLRDEIGKVIVGQDEVVEGVLVCLAANGHVLLEGMPGLGKTLLIRTLSQALDLSFSRLQFTPDMMPADVTGTNVLSEDASGKREFAFRKGPVFAHLVLADEINRATPKTQSALLEAMQERQVTVGGAHYSLPEPFLIMATQNPIEQEGTYPLPEAQMDRFFYKINVPYPTKKDLAEVVKRTTGTVTSEAGKVASGADVLRARKLIGHVKVAEDVLNYALQIVVATHPGGEAAPISEQYCRYGASPRGAQTIINASKVYALMNGRFNVSRDDVKKAAKPALRHRLLLNFEAEADGIGADQVVDGIVQFVESQGRDPVGA